MKLIVNGEPRRNESANLGDLLAVVLAELEIADARGFAMALNGVIVTRSQWNATWLADGDKVEIVRARQGG